MIEKILTTGELEQVYDRLADGIDTAIEAAGPEKVPLFLAKLALALANLLGDPAKLGDAVDAALRDL